MLCLGFLLCVVSVFASYLSVCAICSLPCSLILPSPPAPVPSIVLTDPSINQQRPPFVVVICPALIGGFVAWVAVCYDGPVHPSMAFLLTGITSVRSVSQRSRGRMSPWVTTLHSPRRKYSPSVLLSMTKGEASPPVWLGCGIVFILTLPPFIL